jgi:hypothetical protein
LEDDQAASSRAIEIPARTFKLFRHIRTYYCHFS